MIAKSLDIVVFLKLLLLEGKKKPYAELSSDLGISASEIHAAVRRGVFADLVEEETRRIRNKALEEYLVYGVKYAFPAKRGTIVRGIPTAHAASPLVEHFGGDELPPVWPDPEGTIKGYAIEPLYTSCPKAAKKDDKLYELLVLVDVLRIGRARERKFAEAKLKEKIAHANAH